MPYESPLKSRLADLVRGTPLEYLVIRLEARTLPPLVPPRPWDESLSDEISGRSPALLFGGDDRVADLDAARCVQSGLLLWNDDLDASHTISQGINTPSGSYWHGIMHRREPDYSNSKYWFRRVDEHPCYDELRRLAVGPGTGSSDPVVMRMVKAIECSAEWDPFRLVDWCEAAARDVQVEQERFLRTVQLEELRLLLLHCLNRGLRR